ncbi:MAG: head morphogenesis protein, partial [Betaproteobacteria bacterium]|nr:head morphogenesis protein [Betaproteobacteria bacterium]
MTAFGFGTPFAEQLDFFRAKLNLPTDRWDDIQRAAHDRAFIVAGAGEADLLADLRAAVDKAIAEGGG